MSRIEIQVKGLFATPVAAAVLPDAAGRNAVLEELILRRRAIVTCRSWRRSISRVVAATSAALLDRLTHHCDIVETGTRAGASRTAPDPPPRSHPFHAAI